MVTHGYSAVQEITIPQKNTTKSRSYGRRSSTDDVGAMTFVLRFAWLVAFDVDGLECPYDFEESEWQPANVG